MAGDSLFSANNPSMEPLAFRMRPRTLDEYIGQEHILGKGRLLRRAIQIDQLSSVIFYGPPGTGKTTLARVIANHTKSHFSTLNAVLAGVKDIRAEIDEAKERRDHYGMRTILFVDEVHRWNKSQQDALLPWVENGTFILIGATTENPFFEVNAALVSRSRIFQLKKLSDENLRDIALQAVNDRERGYGKYDVEFEDGALEHLIKVSSGDARSLLNALELAVETTPDVFPPDEGERIYISREIAEESIQQKAVLYDKEGDYHFDVISAFIKSLRGSDPDAAMYWLSKMVKAGEDPRFIFRRMLILACEDVSLADPNAIVVVNADAEAFDRIGLPEGRYHLAHAALYLATCPKSNSTMAFFDALKDVESEKEDDVPTHLKDPSRDTEGFGHGKGYLYPHSYRDHWVAQQYLPKALMGRIYYNPTDQGYEKTIRDGVLERREAQLEAVTSDLFREQLTFTPKSLDEKWEERAVNKRSEELLSITKELFSGLGVLRHDNILVLNASHGLMLWPLMKRNPEGLSVAVVKDEGQKSIIEHFSKDFDELRKPLVIIDDGKSDVFSKLEDGLLFKAVAGRNLLLSPESALSILRSIENRLEDNGNILLMESIPSLSSRLSEFAGGELKDRLLEAEKTLYFSLNWSMDDLEKSIKSIFPNTKFEEREIKEERVFSMSVIENWYRNTFSSYGIDRDIFFGAFLNRKVEWKNKILLIRGTK